MTTTESTPLDTAPSSAGHRARTEKRWWRRGWRKGSYQDLPAVYVTSDVLARVISGVVAAVLAAGMARWVIEANHRFFVPHPIRPVQFRVPQLLLAVAGLTAALVQVAYLTYFATTDRIWRRFRGVSITFAVLASAWTAAWLIDRYVLDAVFLD